MNRPTFQEKTEVKVISHDFTAFYRINGEDKNYDMYGWRGKVTEIIGFDDNRNEIAKPYTPENYPTKWWVNVEFISPVDGKSCRVTFDNWPEQLATVQKKFIDIENLREKDEVIGQNSEGLDIIRRSNAGAFTEGDIIQISTKIDGANASIAWDETTGQLEIFSRTNKLDPTKNDLRGFYNYIKTVIEPKIDWKNMGKKQNLVIFGEWCVGHSITYNKEWYNKWRIYDIWDKADNNYWSQDAVRAFCMTFDLEYIEELYYGPFVSWEHCRSFIGKSTAYGPQQEGVVIKNQTKLDDMTVRSPKYIKIVDEKFKERMEKPKEKKPVDPEVEAARQKAFELAETVVTEARVKKIILKLIDEKILPENLTPKDMGNVMKHLPKLVYADIEKEEPETLKALAENGGKTVATVAAKIARKIVVGE